MLQQNVQSILSSTRALAQSAEDRQAQGRSGTRRARGTLAQAEAVARAGQNASNLFQTVFGSSPAAAVTDKQDIVVNQIAGTSVGDGNGAPASARPAVPGRHRLVVADVRC